MSTQSGFGRRVRLGGMIAAAMLITVGMASCGKAAGAKAIATPYVQTSQPSVDPSPTPLPSPSPSASPKPSPTKSAKPRTDSTTAQPKSSAKPSPSHTPSPSDSQCVKPAHGTFTVAAGGSAVAGTAGHLYHYEVQVQNGIGVTPANFAAAIDATLSNKLGWTDNGTRRFQRVSGGTCDFVVELATASTSEKICAYYGLNTGGTVSCRGGKEVVINLDRWNTADPDPAWTGHLDVYRDLVVDHEVGHFLGYHHMACSGTGNLLPVMATPYTTGLQGCVINGFPYDSTNTFISGPPEP